MSSTYIASAIEALAYAEDTEMEDETPTYWLLNSIAHSQIAIAEELAELNKNLRDANEIPAVLGEVCDRISEVDGKLLDIYNNM